MKLPVCASQSLTPEKASKVGGAGGRIDARAVYVAATEANLERLLVVIAKTKSC